jgi:hypothetical protein
MTKADCIYEVTVYDIDTKETVYIHTINGMHIEDLKIISEIKCFRQWHV